MANGTFNFTVTATDAFGCTGSFAYTLNIGCTTITISPASLQNQIAGRSFTVTLSATGGAAPYSFSTQGPLPPGVTLSTTGVLSGAATQSGTFTFTVMTVDANGCNANGCTGSITYTLTIACPQILINPNSLPSGTRLLAYSETLSATNGTAPYSYAVTAGALPGGLTLSSSGTISGNPTAAGKFTFTVTATDANGCTGTRSYTIQICSNVISLTTLPTTAKVNSVFSQLITASGGTGPYTFTIASGSLPPRLALSSNGSVSGTPVTPGTYTFTVKATDSTGCSGTRTYTITVTQ
jgi:hypothetical protein